MAKRLDEISARRLALAEAAASCAIDQLQEGVGAAVEEFVVTVAPELEGQVRLDFAVAALRAVASGIEKAGAILLRKEAGGG